MFKTDISIYIMGTLHHIPRETLVAGNIWVFGDAAVSTASDCRQNGRPADTPEGPRSTADAARYHGNPGEAPTDVRHAAGAVQHRPRVAATTHRHCSRVSAEYQLQLGMQRQVWLIPIADERVGMQVKL